MPRRSFSRGSVYKRVLSSQVLWLRCAHSGNAVDTTCGALDQIGPDVFILLRARFAMDVARPRGSCFAPCKLLDLTRRTETTAVATKFTRYGRPGSMGLTQALPTILIEGNSIYWQSPPFCHVEASVRGSMYKRVLSSQVRWLLSVLK